MTIPAQIGATPVPDPDETPEARPPTPFNQFLIEQRRGLLHSEATEALREVTAAVFEHGKAGSVTITITISPSKMDGVVELSDEVKSKVPQPPRQAGLFYTDAEGHLERSDPRQPQIPGLREAGRPDDRRSA